MSWKTFDSSIFKQFFDADNVDVIAWRDNVVEKLLSEGILPKYIDRDSEDLEDFCNAIAQFYAFLTIYTRKFKEFRDVELLLDTYLNNIGLIYSDQETIIQKNALVESYYDEIRKRGTSAIYKTGATVNGELLRAIAYDENDEFIFNLHLPHTIGWSIGNSSPLFKSLENQLGTNKSYESTKDFVDLNLYPTFGNGTQAIITDGDKEVYSILNIPIGETAGIGDDDINFAINIDSGLDYEICFWVRQPILEQRITFGALGYDINDTLVDFARVTDLVVENNFFEEVRLANANDYFFVRGIIYNKDAIPSEVATGCFANGINLKTNLSIVKMIPYIALNNSSGVDAVNEIRIWDLKIRPVSSNYSTGFISPKNFISIWANHKNAEISRDKLEGYLRRFLLPYDTSFKFNYLNDDFEETLIPPAMPENLVAAISNDTENDLMWDDVSDNETGFNIERSDDGVTWYPLDSVETDIENYTDEL
jgi:hypothetical protein